MYIIDIIANTRTTYLMRIVVFQYVYTRRKNKINIIPFDIPNLFVNNHKKSFKIWNNSIFIIINK